MLTLTPETLILGGSLHSLIYAYIFECPVVVIGTDYIPLEAERGDIELEVFNHLFGVQPNRVLKKVSQNTSIGLCATPELHQWSSIAAYLNMRGLLFYYPHYTDIFLDLDELEVHIDTLKTSFKYEKLIIFNEPAYYGQIIPKENKYYQIIDKFEFDCPLFNSRNATLSNHPNVFNIWNPTSREAYIELMVSPEEYKHIDNSYSEVQIILNEALEESKILTRYPNFICRFAGRVVRVYPVECRQNDKIHYITSNNLQAQELLKTQTRYEPNFYRNLYSKSRRIYY